MKLEDAEPAARDARRGNRPRPPRCAKLVGEQLPELLKGYARVPEPLRKGGAQRADPRPAARAGAPPDRRGDRRDDRAARAGRPRRRWRRAGGISRSAIGTTG
ncbi:MAG: hypothetical protein WDN24_07070 [Sphingomonas sp.]